MVEDVSLNDTVEELPSYEAEFTVDGSGGTTSKIPSLAVVMGESRISVLEEGNSNWKWVSA